ncbi:MAG: DUF1549 domain-containing protein [Planctomycetota bacterium]
MRVNFYLMVSLIGFGGIVMAGEIDFSHDIVPVLRQHCTECHTGAKKKGGLSMNSRADLLRGGENGAVVVPGKSAESKLFKAVISKEDDVRMPPPGGKHEALTPAQVELVKRWIDGGVQWTDGYSFSKPSYDPPLLPRKPELPPVVEERTNPIDRIIDADFAKRKAARPGGIDDGAFLRRVSLDVLGLLPTQEALDKFVADPAPDKRARVIKELLADDVDYAEHWLTFWNDLLRNDYAGTGYIDGGRKAISAWLYKSLIENKPYDQFARELLSPNSESEGFARGIKWRGTVSAGQVVPVQFAQSVGQTFLGINLKCASCHDSFIDKWTLDQAYGLAAIYSPEPLQIHRCDKPNGKTAKASWLFPETGNIDPSKPPAERLKQLAELMTGPKNGRFSRTLVNRLWHRTMGRGIVHPLDAMQTEPWSADLLDFLAVDFAEHKYDVKQTLALICNSAAYQSRSEVLKPGMDDHGYVYNGPRARRLSAEQFTDAVWLLTGTAPTKFDAPIKRGAPEKVAAVPAATPVAALNGKWIWSHDNSTPANAGETITLRKTITFSALPDSSVGVATCDNEFTLYLNGSVIASSTAWEQPIALDFASKLKKGVNEFLVVAKNGGTGPNLAGFFFEATFKIGGKPQTLASDATWEWTSAKPNAKGVIPAKPAHDFKPAKLVANPGAWESINDELKAALGREIVASKHMVRASLMKSDMLMRTLGRPNREQIVSMRPDDLSTLEAMDLINGQILATRLENGAQNVLKRQWKSSDELTRWLYASALSRPANEKELALARDVLGTTPTSQSVQDLIWAVLMLPEFQFAR